MDIYFSNILWVEHFVGATCYASCLRGVWLLAVHAGGKVLLPQQCMPQTHARLHRCDTQ